MKKHFLEMFTNKACLDKALFPLALIVALFICGSLCIKAQTTPPSQPQPAATPQSTGNSSNTSADARAAAAANAREVEGAFSDMQALEIPVNEESSNKSSIFELTRNLYRKPNKNEMKILAPSIDYLNKYASFLHQPNTGIAKLNSDSSCTGENAGVINVQENCLQYSMPGAGTAYSFRTESYRILRLADLTLSKNILKSDGILQQGILVNLGNVALEDVTVQTKGLQYLVDFKPLTDLEELVKLDRQLMEGIKIDGFSYGVGYQVKNQTTYALRSIAYNGKAVRSIKGIAYNEFDFDKRKDILVVFRIVEMETNGNLTIVWKILSSKDSPTLKIKKTKSN